MKIQLLRHGRTAGNLRRAYIGTTDYPLCPEGIAGINENIAAGCYQKAETVYCSPLRRCVETAALIFPTQQPVLLQGLAERDFGVFENMSHSEITAQPGFESWGMDEAGMIFPGGEEWDTFAERALHAFRSIPQQQECVAVVCHGGTIMALMGYYLPSASHHDWFCEPGQGYLLEWNIPADSLSVVGRICP